MYYELGLKLLRAGGLIAIDNVLWYGKVADMDKNNNKSDDDKENDDDFLTGDDFNTGDEGTTKKKEKKKKRSFDKQTQALRALNLKLLSDDRVRQHCLVPIGDGLTLCQKL